jgi:ribosomal protein S19
LLAAYKILKHFSKGVGKRCELYTGLSRRKDAKNVKFLVTRFYVSGVPLFKTVIFDRSSYISRRLSGRFISVHNGSKFVNFRVKDDMVGFRFGEFAAPKQFVMSIHLTNRRERHAAWLKEEEKKIIERRRSLKMGRDEFKKKDGKYISLKEIALNAVASQPVMNPKDKAEKELEEGSFRMESPTKGLGGAKNDSSSNRLKFTKT